MDENMNNARLDLLQEQYEPVLSQAMDLELMEAEITVSAFDITQDHVFETCYGDVRKIVDALRDYSRLLEMACDTWELQGFHRAKYEVEAKKLREIADKFQAGIGYDYDAALERCRKKQGKKPRNEDVGGEALAMGLLKAQQAAEAKARKAAEKETGERASQAEASTGSDSRWEDF